MKYLALLFCIVFSLSATAQTQSPIVQGSKLYEFKNGVKIDSAFFLPRRDTTITDAAMKAPGMLVYNTADSSLYIRNSFRWSSVSDGSVITVDNIAGLRLYNGYSRGKLNAYVKGYYTANDGGGGWFVFDATSTATDNSGTIIKPTSATTGRWFRDINPSASILNVKWFGAKGDGSNDDTNPIQLALTASRAGGTVYFPETGLLNATRFYKITTGLHLDSAGVTLLSDGVYESSAVIRTAVTNITMLTVNNSNVSIKNMSFVGDGGVLLSPVPTTNGVKINGDAAGNADVLIHSSCFFLLNQCISAKARNVNMFDNLFSNSRYGFIADTILVAGEMRGFVVSRNRFHTMGKFQLTDACVYSTDKSNFEFQLMDNYADGQANAYFALLKASKNVVISDNHCTLNRTAFIQLDTCTVFTISGNEFAGGLSAPAALPVIYLNGSGYGSVTGNVITNSQQEAIKLNNGGCVGNLISNNKIVDYSIATSGFYGISASAATTNNVITNNHIQSPNASYTPGGSVLNSNNLNSTFNNQYHPTTGLGRPAWVESNSNLMLNNTATNQYIMRAGQASGALATIIQAGEGSDPWGGAIAVFGAAHASFPGQVRAGLSSNASSKFVVNTAGLTTSGTDLFTVNANGSCNFTGSLSVPITTTTTGITLSTSNSTVLVNNSGSVTITLPTAASAINRVYVIKKISAAANDVVIDPNGVETLDGATTKTLTLQYSSVSIQSNGTSWFVLSSHVAATTL